VLLRSKMEHLHEIADRRHVARHIGIDLVRHWIREIVAAATRQWRNAPIALDEFENGDVVVVGMHHASAPRMRGNGQQRHARSVAEEIERLDEP